MVNILISAAALLVLVSARKEEYCHLESCNNYVTEPKYRILPEDHTACVYSSTDIGKLCGSIISNSVTPKEKQEILKVHNDHRRFVAAGLEKRGIAGSQPSAKKIPDLQWSNEVAEIAQLWANQCVSGHDKCRDTKRSKVGQNVAYAAATNGPTDTITGLMNSWYNEVKDFNPKLVRSFSSNGPMIGHYTQMVWANTTHVGCGLIRYSTRSYKSNLRLVCNYEPAGNWMGEPVYEVGLNANAARNTVYDKQYNQGRPKTQVNRSNFDRQYDQANPSIQYGKRNPSIQHDPRNPSIQYDQLNPSNRYKQRDHRIQYDQRNPDQWYDLRYPSIRYKHQGYPVTRDEYYSRLLAKIEP